MNSGSELNPLQIYTDFVHLQADAPEMPVFVNNF